MNIVKHPATLCRGGDAVFATFFEKKVAPKNFWENGWLEVCTNTSKAILYKKTETFVYCVLQRIARAIFWVPPPQKIIKVRFAWKWD